MEIEQNLMNNFKIINLKISTLLCSAPGYSYFFFFSFEPIVFKYNFFYPSYSYLIPNCKNSKKAINLFFHFPLGVNI